MIISPHLKELLEFHCYVNPGSGSFREMSPNACDDCDCVVGSHKTKTWDRDLISKLVVSYLMALRFWDPLETRMKICFISSLDSD